MIIVVIIIILVYACLDFGKIYDYSHINYVRHMHICAPRTIGELQNLVRTTDKFCIVGAGYSFGGHTLLENGVQISLHHLNEIQASDTEVTAGAGATWFQVTEYLSQRGRAVAVCQSYFNFSVGGSISVNCHGRDVVWGSIANTVLSLRVMLTDGQIVECGSESELFCGVIGGYGLLGIIVAATLVTTPNYKLRCLITSEPLRTLDDVVFYGANIYPRDLGKIHHYYWIVTTAPATAPLLKSRNRSHVVTRVLEQLVRLGLLKYLRAKLEPILDQGRVHYKSYEMDDATQHQPYIKRPYTTLLQEYFVPVAHIEEFLVELLSQQHRLNMININIRYVRANSIALWNHTPVDSFSVVLYFAIIPGYNALCEFTTHMLQVTKSLSGNFYLPYLQTYPPGIVAEFYPVAKMCELKARYDPADKINNEWWRKIKLNL